MIVGTPYITTRHYVVSEAAIDKTETLKLVRECYNLHCGREQFEQTGQHKLLSIFLLSVSIAEHFQLHH